MQGLKLPSGAATVYAYTNHPRSPHSWCSVPASHCTVHNAGCVTWLLLLCVAAHLPFSHHKLTPVMLRDKASSMPFTQLEVPAGSSPEEAAARPSFCFEHQAPLAAFQFPSGVCWMNT